MVLLKPRAVGLTQDQPVTPRRSGTQVPCATEEMPATEPSAGHGRPRLARATASRRLSGCSSSPKQTRHFPFEWHVTLRQQTVRVTKALSYYDGAEFKILFLERGREEKERNVSVWLPPVRPPWGPGPQPRPVP